MSPRGRCANSHPRGAHGPRVPGSARKDPSRATAWDWLHGPVGEGQSPEDSGAPEAPSGCHHLPIAQGPPGWPWAPRRRGSALPGFLPTPCQ